MTKEELNAKILNEEEVVLVELSNSTPGSANREDLLKELERFDEIRRRNDDKRDEVEDRKSRRDMITKLIATGVTFVTAIVMLSYEERGFIRSKVFGWIKFPGK